MDKVTLIATFHMQATRTNDLNASKQLILNVFKENFPNDDFTLWNTELDKTLVDSYLKNLSGVGEMNFISFIEELTF